MNTLSKIKRAKFRSQAGRCYYCDQPMWCEDAKGFAKLYGLSRRSARLFEATAELLVARSAGGPDRATKIVAARLYCNMTRHRAKRALNPDAYARRVKLRLHTGKWHGFLSAIADGPRAFEPVRPPAG